jgi:uncharacterized protein YndB with AHSA1/START domain
MTERSVTHATFVLERTYPVPAARVFQAWSDPRLKRKWFGGDGQAASEYHLDFKVGGTEISRGSLPDGAGSYSYDARYQDIVQDERIVYSYDMHLGGPRISVSLSTVELKPSGDGTLLVYTEQGAYLDGLDNPEQREHGTRELLEALGALLQTQGATA